MIFIVYGTRAELIKFSTVIKELARRKAQFKTVDIGQHDNEPLRKSLGLPKPDFHLGRSYRDKWSKLEASYLTYPLASLLAIVWGAGVFIKLSNKISKGDVVVTHGNTMGVPLVIFSTKLKNYDFTSKPGSDRSRKLVHMESGFRGGTKNARLLDMIYKFADKRSDVLFAPFDSAKNNLKSERVKGSVIVSGDVMKDVVKDVLKKKVKVKVPKKFVLVNITRSVTNKHDAKQLLHAISDSPVEVVLMTNPVIKERIRKFGLGKMLRSGKVETREPANYPEFLHMLNKSAGAITDSNGVQEECAVLGKPCIVTNDFVQIPELEAGGVVRKTGCNYISIIKNLRRISEGKWKVKKSSMGAGSPTKKIVDQLIKMERSSR